MIFSGDSIKVTLKGYVPSPHAVPYGTDVTGVYFDGYPQIVKQEGSKPVYGVKTEKNIMVAMRDGVRIAIDVYRPDIEGKKFPAILAWGIWGKEPQEMVRWMAEARQNGKDKILLAPQRRSFNQTRGGVAGTGRIDATGPVSGSHGILPSIWHTAIRKGDRNHRADRSVSGCLDRQRRYKLDGRSRGRGFRGQSAMDQLRVLESGPPGDR